MALYVVFSVIAVIINYLVPKIREKVVEKIVDYLVAPIVDYLLAPIGRQLGYVYCLIGRLLGSLFCYSGNIEDFKKQVESLETERARVQQLVDVAKINGEEVLPDVETWLTKVNKITEESMNFLNEELQVNTRFFNGRVCPNLKLRYQRSKEAMTKTTEVGELIRVGNFDSISRPEDFDSRKLILKEIMEALKDDRINMIGVYGAGGVGKTRLVEAVRRQAKEDKLFDETVLAAVSQTPNIRRIQGEIADMLGPKLDKETEKGRARQLSTGLEKKKRILVILDDVWEEIQLEAIGIPFGAKQRGCKIVLTSRSQDVCEKMRSQKNFPIQVLPEKEAWNLFREMAGDLVDSTDLHPLAVQIAKECAGLPIAIVTLATALKNKPLFYWRDAANQLSRSIIPDEKLLETLKLSYNYLKNEEAKSFFLLCCLYPEDSDISIGELSGCGMGLDLFEDVDTVFEVRERAFRLANDLKSSCLLLDGLSNENFVRMHDVIRGVAISIASKDKHAFLVRAGAGWKDLPRKDTFKRYTAMSLWSDDIHELPSELECPKLQMLLLSFPHPSLQFPNNFFSRMENLKVLLIFNMNFPSLPPSLRHLKNLRTLCLNYCKLKDLSIIGELEKLEILSLTCSKIKELPKEIGMLNNLRMLSLVSCRDLTIIPPDVIRALSQLEILHMEASFDKWEIERQDEERSSPSLAELKQLSRLIVLSIDISSPTLWLDDLLFQNLSRFCISIGNFRSTPWDGYSYSKSLRLEVNLTTPLKDGVSVLLKEAKYLQLRKMKGLKNIIYDLDTRGFQHLRRLQVQKCDEVEYIFNSSQCGALRDAFPMLEKLDLHRLRNLKEICHDQHPSGFSCRFHNLRVVEVFGCKGLKNLFSHSIAKDLSKLVELNVKSCKIMEQIFGNENEAAMDDLDFPHLRSVKLLRLPKLKNFALKDDLDFHNGQSLFNKKVALLALEDLEILGGGNFKEIWHPQFSAMSSFSRLKILKVANCNKLLNVIPFNLLQSLRSLEKLCVARCDSVEEIIEVGRLGVEEGHASAVLSQLRFLLLGKLPKLEHMWWDFPHGALGYRNLTSIHIFECNILKSAFSPSIASSLVLLQELKIVSCQMMETIIAKDRHREVKIIVFPQLRTLVLQNLPKLMGFYTGIDESTEEGDPSISIQPLFDDKVTFPTLQTMQIEGVDNLKDIWHPRLPVESFRQLRWVGVYHCHKLLNVVPSNLLKGLTNLEEFYVADCDSVEIIFEIEGLDIKDRHGIGPLSQLRKLKLFRLPKLRDIWLTQDPNDSLSLPNLSLLHIYKCDSLKSIFSPSIATSLVQLEEVDINACEQMEAIVMKETEGEANPVEIIVFPRVHTLKLGTLPNLTSFHMGSCTLKWPSLKKLWILMCPRIKSFTSKHLFLQNLQMNDEESEEKPQEGNSSIPMRPLFDEWVTFPILEELKISGLDDLKDIWHPQLPIESFCQLQVLNVKRCHKLVNVVPSNLLKVLKNLETVFVRECDSVEIIFEIDAAEDRHGTSTLSRLRQLGLEALPKLFTSEHPLLQNLQVNNEEFEEKAGEGNSSIPIQPLFDKSVTFPILDELRIIGLDNLKDIWHPQLPTESFCQLRFLVVERCHKLVNVVPSNLLKVLKNLEVVGVIDCDLVEIIFEIDAAEDRHGTWILSRLRHLELVGLPKLFTSKHPLLQNLQVNNEEFKEKAGEGNSSIPIQPLFDKSVALTKLEYLWILEIENLQEIFPSQLLDESFCQLKLLQVRGCPKLSRVALSNLLPRLKKLEELYVEECDSMKEIFELEGLAGEGHVSLFQLKDVELCHLTNLRIFCSGNYNFEFPSLKRLALEKCPKMQTFSSGSISTPKLDSIELTLKDREKRWEGSLNRTVEQLFQEKEEEEEECRQFLISLFQEEEEENISAQEIQHEIP